MNTGWSPTGYTGEVSRLYVAHAVDLLILPPFARAACCSSRRFDPHSVLRHPSYFGWFYWSVGTQILLGNPVCSVLYTYAAWSFFHKRYCATL